RLPSEGVSPRDEKAQYPRGLKSARKQKGPEYHPAKAGCFDTDPGRECFHTDPRRSAFTKILAGSASTQIPSGGVPPHKSRFSGEGARATCTAMEIYCAVAGRTASRSLAAVEASKPSITSTKLP